MASSGQRSGRLSPQLLREPAIPDPRNRNHPWLAEVPLDLGARRIRIALMEDRRFPILAPGRGHNSVPFGFVEQCRAQAMINHSQTLERLAERGGLSWAELYMCLTKQRWSGRYLNENAAQAAVLYAFDWLQAERENLDAGRIEAIKAKYATELEWNEVFSAMHQRKP